MRLLTFGACLLAGTAATFSASADDAASVPAARTAQSTATITQSGPDGTRTTVRSTTGSQTVTRRSGNSTATVTQGPAIGTGRGRQAAIDAAVGSMFDDDCSNDPAPAPKKGTGTPEKNGTAANGTTSGREAGKLANLPALSGDRDCSARTDASGAAEPSGIREAQDETSSPEGTRDGDKTSIERRMKDRLDVERKSSDRFRELYLRRSH